MDMDTPDTDEKVNPMRRTFWFNWKYNVSTPTGPLREYGVVCYTDDGFGNLIIVTQSAINISLRD